MSILKSKVMTIANRLHKTGMSRTTATVKAWIIAKAEALTTRVTGVSYENRQKALKAISKYKPSEISITLKREPHNHYDRNAVAVYATLPNRVCYCIGYLPKAVAFVVAPLIDKGRIPQDKGFYVVGGFAEYISYGARLNLAV